MSYDNLLITLNTSRLQQSNSALYQVIKNLISAVQSFQKLIDSDLNSIIGAIEVQNGQIVINVTTNLSPFYSAELWALCLDPSGNAGKLVFSLDPSFENDINVLNDINLTGLLRWGSTASDPMLKRNAAVLEVKLANDSAYGILRVGRYITTVSSMGVAGSGATAFHDIRQLQSANPDGTSVMEGFRARQTLEGANSAVTLRTLGGETQISATAGVVGSVQNVRGSATLDNAANVTDLFSFISALTLTGTGSITGQYTGFRLITPTKTGAGDITGAIRGIHISNIGRAAATTVFGVQVEAQTKGSGDSYALLLQNAAAAGVWNIRVTGTAQNAFAGNVGIGLTTPAIALELAATLGFGWEGRSRIYSPSNGIITLFNNAEADFNRLQLGGTTNAFPALKRSTTQLQARLGDDSDFTSLALSFLEQSVITVPATPASGFKRYWTQDIGGKNFLTALGPDGSNLALARDNVIVVRNTTGGILTKGQAVYFNGSSTGNFPHVSLAQSDSDATMPAIGLLFEDIADNGFGRVMVWGRLSFDTSAFSDGDLLYISDSVAGGLTATPPASPNLLQRIAVVAVSGIGNGAAIITQTTVRQQGASGSFTAQSGEVVTVVNGLITSIV